MCKPLDIQLPAACSHKQLKSPILSLHPTGPIWLGCSVAWRDLPKQALHSLRLYKWFISQPHGPKLLQKEGMPRLWQHLDRPASWLGVCWILVSTAGLVSVGVGDAAAAIVGRLWGRRRLWKRTRKTWEGLIAAMVSMLLTTAGFIALCFVHGNPAFGASTQICGVLMAVALLEAITKQLDNLVLPLFHCTAMLLLVSWWTGPEDADAEAAAMMTKT